MLRGTHGRLCMAVFLPALLLSPRVSSSACIRYEEYLHTRAVMQTPATPLDIATSGWLAYVVQGGSGLLVVDLSHPASPTILGSVDTPGFAYGVAVSGDFAYVADNDGLQVIDVSNRASPLIVGSVDTPGNARGVALSGGFAYVADGYSGVLVVDVSNPALPQIVGGVDTPDFAIDLVLSGTIAYVSDWRSGLQVIDVSNPASPMILGSVDTPDYAMKVAVSGTTVFVAGQHGMQIIDASNPSVPVIEASMGPTSTVYDVAVSGTVLYLAGYWSGLQVFDVSNPSSPKWQGSVPTLSYAYAIALSGASACIVESDGHQLEMIDISNPVSPGILGHTPGNGVAVSGTMLYTTDQIFNPGGTSCSSSFLYVVDVTAPTVPVSLGSVELSGCGGRLAVSGTVAYVVDGSGLELIDVSNAASPVILGRVDTPGSALDVEVSGTLAYVADGSSGLRVVDVSNPASPTILGSVDTPGSAWNIAVSGALVYVADYPLGLCIVDVSDPYSPSILGSVDTPGMASDVAVSGSMAFLADWSGLQVIDVSNPVAPVVLGSVGTPEEARGVSVVGNVAYVAEYSYLQAIDVSVPTSPRILGGGSGGGGGRIAASESAVYVGGVNIFPLECGNASPVIQNPGPQTGVEGRYFSVTVSATHPLQSELSMSPLGPIPSWISFSDLGGGHAWLRGTPASGQAGTYPITVLASVPTALDTAAFSIAIGPIPPETVRDTLTTSGFSPGLDIIRTGGTVVWRFGAHGNHTTTNGTGPLDPDAGTLWDAPLSLKSLTWSHQFPVSGTYPYFCRNHPSETGAVVVTASQVGIGEKKASLFRLVPASNPFRNAVDLRFDLDQPERVRIIILDVQGRRVRDLLSADLPAGPHQVTWGGRNENLQPVPPGVYFVRLTTDDGRSLAQKLFKTR